MKSVSFWAVVVVCVAFTFRLPELASKPMHADEGVLAAKFGELLEGKSYTYDPSDHHGPALAWLTLAVVKAAGVQRYTDLSEVHLRAVAAICGLIVLATPLLLLDVLGRWKALAAAALIAISPGMVYYSRYFIPEMLLTALTGILIVCGFRYAKSNNLIWLYLSGVVAGLMLVTKETAVIVLACLLLALAFTIRPRLHWNWHMLAAALIAAAIPLAIFGPADISRAVEIYFRRGVQAGAHHHPIWFYSSLLIRREVLIAVLALAAVIVLFRRRLPTSADSRAMQFFAIYSGASFLAYSLIPYKTPWCVIGPLQGFAILGGVGAVSLANHIQGRWRAIALSLLAIAAVFTAWESWRSAYVLAADTRNPYAYAHTGPDVDYIRKALDELASSHPDGLAMSIQVLSGQNLWPLPWYFRAFPKVGWWRAVGPNFQLADVILITPEMEPELIHQIYEVPPPGKRELYAPIFDRYVELRPGVEMRGYVRASLAAR